MTFQTSLMLEHFFADITQFVVCTNSDNCKHHDNFLSTNSVDSFSLLEIVKRRCRVTRVVAYSILLRSWIRLLNICSNIGVG